jgi:four helix bundle protein
VPVSDAEIPTTIQFHHERLDVYQTAIDFLVLADSIAENLSRGRGYLADQLCRAATSIPLNIAEGAGEFSRRDKARIYRIARRSAAECAAVAEICVRLRLVDNHQASQARELLFRVISMLTRLTQR